MQAARFLDKPFDLGATSIPRQLIRIYGGNKQIKIASFLAMTTIFIAQGRQEGRQHKTLVIARRNDAAIFIVSKRVQQVAPI